MSLSKGAQIKQGDCTWLLDLLEIRVAQKIAQLYLIVVLDYKLLQRTKTVVQITTNIEPLSGL